MAAFPQDLKFALRSLLRPLESISRIKQLPGLDNAFWGTITPWRDAGNFGPGFQFSADRHVRAGGELSLSARAWRNACFPMAMRLIGM